MITIRRTSAIHPPIIPPISLFVRLDDDPDPDGLRIPVVGGTCVSTVVDAVGVKVGGVAVKTMKSLKSS